MIGLWLDRPGSVVHLADWDGPNRRWRTECRYLGDVERLAGTQDDHITVKDWNERGGRPVRMGWGRDDPDGRRLCAACLARLTWRHAALVHLLDDYDPDTARQFADRAHDAALGYVGWPDYADVRP